MKKHIKQYLTTTEAASELGTSVGTVQKLATTGVLEAIFTQGGHRRILVHSFEKYKIEHGYRELNNGTLMCIFHQGDDLDMTFDKVNEFNKVRVMHHPLELFGIENLVECLLIDARNTWLQTASTGLVMSLRNKYDIFIYNSSELPADSYLLEINSIGLIPQNINCQFISGYYAGKKIGRSQNN